MANLLSLNGKVVGCGDSLGYWTGIFTALAGSTTVTITDPNIKTTSFMDIYSETQSGNTVGITNVSITTNGAAELTFDSELEESAQFVLHIVR